MGAHGYGNGSADHACGRITLSAMPPRKRTIKEISHLHEPRLTGQQNSDFQKGISLFNQGNYWEAHEAWEDVWKTLSDRPEDDGEIILRGLIQFTAGLHKLSTGKLKGGLANLAKAHEKLKLYPDRFLGVDLTEILSSVELSQDTPLELLGYQIRWTDKQ